MGESIAAFEFATAGRILFGTGRTAETGNIARSLGRHALVVTGRSRERAEGVLASLGAAGVATTVFAIATEPTIDAIQMGTAAARESDCDVVVAVGGGSVIDSGKAIAALVTNGGTPLDYLEVIGAGRKLVKPSAPLIAVPTTAGTGAEVTKNAVLASPEHRVKVSLRSPTMLPSVAIVDPELTLSLPPAVTASTGLDALTQCLEPYVSAMANPLSDALAREGLARCARSLLTVYEDGDDLGARSDMAVASLFGGLALANAKLGAVHGFAGVIGGMYEAPHGAVCARLLAPVMKANIQALRSRTAVSGTSRRYDQIGQILTEAPDADAAAGVSWVERTTKRMAVPSLREYGLQQEDLDEIVEKAQGSSSMKGNPVELTREELKSVLEAAL